MVQNIPLKLNGTLIVNPALPALLRPSTRAVDSVAASRFLPDGYLKIKTAFDVSSAARSTPAGAIEQTVSAGDGELVVLEMADGVTVITSAGKLKESLQRMDPRAVEASWHPP